MAELQNGYKPSDAIVHVPSLNGRSPELRLFENGVSEGTRNIDFHSPDGTAAEMQRADEYLQGGNINLVVCPNDRPELEVIETSYDGEAIANDFGIKWPLPPGKTRSLLAHTVFQEAASRLGVRQPEFNFYADTEMMASDWLSKLRWLALVASKYDPGTLCEVKAAEFQRGGEVYGILDFLQLLGPVNRLYSSSNRELVSPLTSTCLKTPRLMSATPFVFPDGGELLGNIASSDFSNRTGGKRAQVEIRVPHENGRYSWNGQTGERLRELAIIQVLSRYVFEQGRALAQMEPEHYREVNQLLRYIDGNYKTVVTHPQQYGPHRMSEIQLGTILPPVDYLIKNGYINAQVAQSVVEQEALLL